ncbi:MAG TPA: hypothetical protein GX731_00245 [Clostridiales bacterium]|nr:hypothetical protein [Clostridiales bacterium]
MRFSFSIESDTINNKSNELTNPYRISDNTKAGGILSLKEGQKVTAVVVKVGDKVTLNLCGQKISTSKEVLKNAFPGQEKVFQVTKSSDSAIELMLIEDQVANGQNTVSTILHLDKDKDNFLAQSQQKSKDMEKEKSILDKEKKLEEIGSKLTEQDLKLLEEAGFSVNHLPVERLYVELNRIKSENNDKSYNPIYLTGTGGNEDQIARRLAAENLPVTDETIKQVSTALAISDAVTLIDDKTVKALIANEQEPSIGNIYRSYYGGDGTKTRYQDLSDQAWNELLPQVEEVIISSGYEVNEVNLEDAKWLVENELPLTKENFTLTKELKYIKDNISRDQIFDHIIDSMRKGEAPLEAPIELGLGEAYEQVIEDIASIEANDLDRAVNNKVDLTIKNIITHKEENQEKEIEANQDPIESIKARRQLEEIRLKMTKEAVLTLEKKGIHIETTQLEQVVNALRDLEENYYKDLLAYSDAPVTKDNISLVKETALHLQWIKQIPSYILGETLSEKTSINLETLLEKGNGIQAKLVQAGEAYETLMTVPNREYGDSIQKAFGNMVPLLEELDIENTPMNQRAVRILAYNNMDISKDNVMKVKSYDLELRTMIDNLHPAVTAQMIKEELNPLEMPIPELSEAISRIKEDMGISSAEKYSTYLRKLDKTEGISEEERKAYIGIYRLLHQIEKSDGAALGSVINAGQEVTLDHLLTAIRTGHKGRVDAKVNDDFGMLESLDRSGETITEQLSAVQGSNIDNASGQIDLSNSNEDITKYMNMMLKQIKENVSPEKLQDIQKEAVSTVALDQDGLINQNTSGKSWEAIGKLPIEKLFEAVNNEVNMTEVEKEVYYDRIRELRTTQKNSDQAIRFLNEFKLPCSASNISMAIHILSDGETAMKKFLNIKEDKVEKSGNPELPIKESADITDTLIDKSSMSEIYDEIARKANADLDYIMNTEVINTRLLDQGISIANQMTFLKTLAEKEFYRIPIETENGVTNMNLTIIRGDNDNGKVSVTIWSEALGNVKAEISIKDDKLQGYISCDDRNGLAHIKDNSTVLKGIAEDSGLTKQKIDYIIHSKGNFNSNYQGIDNGNKGEVSSDTEKTLYRLAKAMIRTVLAAENSIEKEGILNEN